MDSLFPDERILGGQNSGAGKLLRPQRKEKNVGTISESREMEENVYVEQRKRFRSFMKIRKHIKEYIFNLLQGHRANANEIT